MSLSGTFDPLAAAPPTVIPSRKARGKRPAPFAIRLTVDERKRLEAEAAGAPLGTYIKAKALGGEPIRARRAGVAIVDTKALAQLLAILGRTRLFSNLNQLTRLAHIGALPLDDETSGELLAALADVRSMRRLLMTALGLKPEGEA